MPPRKREEYISIKPCPICGEAPERITTDLRRPNGGGYPGHYLYRYECQCCKLLKAEDTDDIYRSKEEAINRAKTDWNTKVAEVQEYLSRLYVLKTM